MEKINFSIFIEKCKNKNIAFLGSINKDIDLLSSIESYNTKWDPNFKKSKSSNEDDYWISI